MEANRAFGLLGQSAPDYRDRLYAAPSDVLAELPDNVDLRPRAATPPVFDQGQLGSCTANAQAAVVQYVERKDNDPDWDRLSRLDLYWYSRAKIGTTNEDSGAFLTDAVKVSAERGVPRERLWPYDISRFTEKPVVADWRAAQHRVLEYRRVTDERTMQSCLAEGYPFVFGFAVYESFDRVGRDGVWYGERGNIIGYHAVCCWGYDFRRGGLGFETGGWIARNSWSSSWGAEGYFYVPRLWLPFEGFDCWTVRKVYR